MTSTTTAPVLAWHSDPALKAEVVARMEQHRAADEIVQGAYQVLDPELASGYKGCLIGCTLPAQPASEYFRGLAGPVATEPSAGWHGRVAAEYGIPAQVGWLLDNLFELLDTGHAEFAVASIAAIPAGADLSQVCDRWALDVLADPTNGRIAAGEVVDLEPEAAAVVRRRIVAVADLFRRRLDGDEPAAAQWAEYGASDNPCDLTDAASEAAVVGLYTGPGTYRPAYYSLLYGGGDSPYANSHVDGGRKPVEEWMADRLLHHLRTAPIPAPAAA